MAQQNPRKVEKLQIYYCFTDLRMHLRKFFEEYSFLCPHFSWTLILVAEYLRIKKMAQQKHGKVEKFQKSIKSMIGTDTRSTRRREVS